MPDECIQADELADELGAYVVPDGDLILADLLFRAEEAIRSSSKMLRDPNAYADVCLSEENDRLIDENKALRALVTELRKAARS